MRPSAVNVAIAVATHDPAQSTVPGQPDLSCRHDSCPLQETLLRDPAEIGVHVRLVGANAAQALHQVAKRLEGRIIWRGGARVLQGRRIYSVKLGRRPLAARSADSSGFKGPRAFVEPIKRQDDLIPGNSQRR